MLINLRLTTLLLPLLLPLLIRIRIIIIVIIIRRLVLLSLKRVITIR